MRALGANKLKLAVAIGEHLLAGRAQFTAHGTWLPWLREFCELGERQARTYVTLAQHRPEVEAYRQRAADMGVEPSIRGALAFISPPQQKKSKKPRKTSELATPAIFGAYLDGNQDSFFQALRFAPSLRAALIERLPVKIVVEVPKGAAEAAAEARAILKLARNTSAPNIDAVCDKASRIARLLGPAKPAALAPSNAKLDLDAFPKARDLDRPDLDIPESLRRDVPVGTTIN
jgi:hypothetical protein